MAAAEHNESISPAGGATSIKGNAAGSRIAALNGTAGVLVTASASTVLALQSAIEAVLPAADESTSVMVFFARPVLGFAVAALLLPLLQRSSGPTASISSLGLAMLAPLAFVPKSLLSYHWAALSGAFIKVPLLCTLLHGEPSWGGWRVAGAFYGILLGPMITALNLPEDTQRVLLATLALCFSTMHFAVANHWTAQQVERNSDVPLAIPAWLSLGGVACAWLLLSVQVALLPLLHALHGHHLTDHQMALGASLLLSSLVLREWSPKRLILALCISAAACALTMRSVAQALGGYNAWQLQAFSLITQLSLGVLLASALQIGRLSTGPAEASVLGCALAAAAFFGEGLGLVLQLLLLPALGALGTLKVLALLPLSYAFWSLRHLGPAICHSDDFQETIEVKT